MSANIPLIRAPFTDYINTIDILLEHGVRYVKITRLFDVGRGRSCQDMFLNKFEEELIINKIKGKYLHLVQSPLSDYSTFIDGALLIDENLCVKAGDNNFSDLTDEEITYFVKKNHELYTSNGYSPS